MKRDGVVRIFLTGFFCFPVPILAGSDVTASIEVVDPTGPDIQYRYTLTNAGDAFIGKSFHNYILLSEDPNITTGDYLVADHAQFTLAAGASFTSSVITDRVGHFPAGEYYLGIYADANAVVPEDDENNNTGFDGSSKIVIDALPDLVLDAVTVTDPDGPSVSFEFSITNIGNTTPTSPYHVPVYLSSDTQVGSDDDYHFITGSVSEGPIPGGTHHHSLTKESLDSAPEGDYYLGVWVDSDNQIAESDDLNNKNYDETTLVHVPYISHSVTYPNGGEVLNKGTDHSITWTSVGGIENVTLYLYKGEVYVPHRTIVGSTENDGLYVFHPPDDLEDGSDYRIRVRSAGGNVEDYSDGYFTIQSPDPDPDPDPKPDIVILALGVSDSTGPDLEYGLWLLNSSAVVYNGTFHNYIYLSPDTTMSPDTDYLIHDYIFSGSLLTGGVPDAKSSGLQSVHVTGVLAGTYYLWGLCDAENDVEESDETNNTSFTTHRRVTLYGDPDTHDWMPQTSGGEERLRCVDAVSGRVVWVGSRDGGIFRTVDRGTFWENVAAGNDSLRINDIAGLSADEAVAVTWSSVSSISHVLRTVNGGGSWEIVFSQPDGFLGSVDLFEDNTGFVIGNPIGDTWTVLRTTDAGDSWEPSIFAPSTIGDESSFTVSSSWSDPDHGWFGSTGPRVYHTTDGGDSWNSLGIDFGTRVARTAFRDDNTGFVAGDGQIGRTTDGGFNWEEILTFGGETVWQVEYHGRGAWALVGDNGDIYRSEDDGDTWIPEGSAGVRLQDVSFTSADDGIHGWAVGDDGTILKYGTVSSGIYDDWNDELLPVGFALHQNYPNPFNPETSIAYELSETSHIQMTICDLNGRDVSRLINELQQPGLHQVLWHGKDDEGKLMPSGIYICLLKAGNFSKSIRMVFLR